MINALTTNDMRLHSYTLNLSAPEGTPPMNVTSGTLVPKFYAERSLYSDHAGNIALDGVIHTLANTAHTVITSKTGFGNTIVVQDSPTLFDPVLGNASAYQLTISGPGAPFVISSNVLVDNLYVARAVSCDNPAGNLWVTGPITINGSLSTITSQSGDGNVFVMQDNALLVNPDFTTPDIGVASGASLSVTGQLTTTVPTGTAPLAVGSTTRVANLNVARAGLADTVSTNANLVGPISSVGNATSINSKTGTGLTFVMDTAPVITNATLITSNIGNATGLSLTVSANITGRQIVSTAPIGVPPFAVTSNTLVQYLYVARAVTADSSGPASICDQIMVEGTGINANLYPALVNSNALSYQDIFTNTGWTWNPNTNKLNVSGLVQAPTFKSTIATGTAPLSVASTTLVNNLYSDRAVLSDSTTTNADLSGPISSIGNTTSVGAQTGTGSVFVMQASPTLTTPTIASIVNVGTLSLPTVTDTLVGRNTTDTLTNKTLVAPVIGSAIGSSLSVSGQLTSTVATGTAPLVVSSSTLVPNLYVDRALIADSATTNANLSGVITSIGNATSTGAQTGTGSVFVMQASPTLTTPNIGTANGSSLSVSGQLTSTVVTGTPPFVVASSTMVANLYVANCMLADDVITNANLSGVINSVGNTTTINSQTGSGSTFVVQTNPVITNPSFSQITNTGVITLPTATDTLVARETTDTLKSKTITDSSNNVLSRGLWCDSGAGSVSVYTAAPPSSGQVLQASSPTVATWATIASAPVTFVDTAFKIYDNADNTKVFKVEVAGSSGKTLTLATQQSDDITLTLPDLTDTLCAISATQTLTNKVLTSATNNVISRGLWTGSGAAAVDVYAATAPVVGQTLVATSGTLATWQDVPTPSTISTSNSAGGTLYLTAVPLNSTANQAAKTTGVYIDGGSSFLVVPGISYTQTQFWAVSTTNQINLGHNGATWTTINSVAPAANRIITINDAGANSYLPLSTNTGTTGYVLTSTGTNSSSWQAASNVMFTTAVITSAQVKALFTTPVVVLAAPGVGFSYRILDVTTSLNYVAPAYTLGGIGDLIYATAATVAYSPLFGTAEVRAAATQSWGYFNGAGLYFLKNNNAVSIRVNSANYATGNSTLTVNITYQIVVVP